MEKKEVVLTFTVAECGEYHNLGEYHEGIRTLEEAISVYKKIPPERMNGIKPQRAILQGKSIIEIVGVAIGINLHVKGTDKVEDSQADILSGDEIDIGIISLMPEFCGNPQVQEAVKEFIRLFPDKEVIDY